MNKYPEHDKLKEISEISQSIGEFLDFWNSKGLSLYEWVKVQDEDDEDRTDSKLLKCNKTIQQLLAEFYEIDLVKLEIEKVKMIEEIRQNIKK